MLCAVQLLPLHVCCLLWVATINRKASGNTSVFCLGEVCHADSCCPVLSVHRESAQRSRARKNCYVRNLEAENRALKVENENLRAMLRQIETAGMAAQGFGTFAPAMPTAPTNGSDSGSEHNTGVSETLSPACAV